jgi:hypothetical protein
MYEFAGQSSEIFNKFRNYMQFPSLEIILENPFFKCNYLRMRRVSHEELKSTKLALQLNEKQEKILQVWPVHKRDIASLFPGNNNIFYICYTSLRSFKYFI